MKLIKKLWMIIGLATIPHLSYAAGGGVAGDEAIIPFAVEGASRVRLVPNFNDEWDTLPGGRQVARAVKQVEVVFNSKAFEDAMESIAAGAGFNFDDSELATKKARDNPVIRFSTEAENITGADVLARIRAGTLPGLLRRDTAAGPEDAIITFGIDAYKTKWPFSSVTGYTNTVDNVISINLRRFNVGRVTGLTRYYYKFCNTVAHELLHCLDYEHSGGTAWEPNSVPYVVGDVVEQLLLTAHP